MNEFLLLAVVIVYLAISHGAPVTKTGEDRQPPENKHSDYPAGKK
jgi:hypothetical protein